MKYELTLVLGVSLALLKVNATDNRFWEYDRSDFSHIPMNIFQIVMIVPHPFLQR